MLKILIFININRYQLLSNVALMQHNGESEKFKNL